MSSHDASTSNSDLKDYHKELRRKLRRLRIKGDAVKELGVELGHGAYAKVVLLEVYGTHYAGKRLHDEFFNDTSHDEMTSLVDKFAEECIRLGSLRHPNVVQLAGITFDSKSLTLVMEYLPMTLTDFLERYESMMEFTKASVLMDVAYGMLYLHQQDPPIIHRDLSTKNILLTQTLRAKIADLGVARRLPPSEDGGGASGLAQLMSLCPGTQLFMPPEALTGTLENPDKAEYDTKVDCFSFGNIIIQVMVQKWLEFLLEADPEDPSRPLKNEVERRSLYLMEMTDHPLYDLTVACLQDLPANRPSSADVVKRLKAFKEDNPPPFENSVEMWNAYLQLNKRFTGAHSDLAELKSSGEDMESSSFEKLKARVRTLEVELMEKKKELEKKDSEITGYKSSITSMKKMLALVKPLESNGDIPTSHADRKHQEASRPSPAPPSRDKKKQAPPKPPRPWAFSSSSSPPISPPPLLPESPPPIPKPRPRAANVDTTQTPSPPQVKPNDPMYSDLPGFPADISPVTTMTPLHDKGEPPPNHHSAQIRSKPSVSPDVIEISGPSQLLPQPRPRARTHGARDISPRPHPRKFSDPPQPPVYIKAKDGDGSPPPSSGVSAGPQKTHRKTRSEVDKPTPFSTHIEPVRKETIPEKAAPDIKLSAHGHRRKPLPPIPKMPGIIKGPLPPQPEARLYDTADGDEGHYEIPIPIPGIISSGHRKQQQKQPEPQGEVARRPGGTSIYEIPLPPASSKPMEKPKSGRDSQPSKLKRPPPPPRPQPYSPGSPPKKSPHPGIPKLAMLPGTTGAENSQLQKLLARQQQKVEQGSPGEHFRQLEKQRSQPQTVTDKTQVDPTLQRALAKQKERSQPKPPEKRFK